MEGGRMLLPGQRFCPMEDELLMFYLQPKVNGMEVPGNKDVICELDLYGDQDPWKIWERFEARKANDLRRNKDLYFFTQKKKKTAKSSRISRTVGSGGTWKGQNAAKEIYLLDDNQQPTTTLLGFKKTYTYKNKESVHDGRWIMYEFELDKSQLVHKNQVNKNDCVLCLLRKNDVLPEKKRKRQEEEEMLGDYVEDDDGDNTDPESVTEEQQEKRQRLLPSLEAEQEQFLQPTPSLESEQEAVPAPLEDEPLLLQVDENMELQQMELAALEKWFDEEFEARPTTLEAEQVSLLVDENSGLQQLEAEPQLGEEIWSSNLIDAPSFAADEIMSGLQFHPDENPVEQMGAELEKRFEVEFEARHTTLEAEQVSLPVDDNSDLQQLEAEPQLGGENLKQQLDAPSFAADEIMSGFQFHPDENPAKQMGAEANVYGGNLSDAMDGENWPMFFVEELMNDEQPNTIEMGEWNATFSDFEYLEF